MLWNHVNSQIELLVGPESAGEMSRVRNAAYQTGGGPLLGSVLAFSDSEHGRKVALQLQEVGAYNLSMLSLDTRKSISLVDQTGNLLDMSISPDGHKVVYVPQDSLTMTVHPPTTTPSTTPSPADSVLWPPQPLLSSLVGIQLAASVRRPRAGGGPMSGKILVVRADAPNQPHAVGYCAEVDISLDYRFGCQGVLWSPDSSALVWGDGRGMWLSDLKAPAHLVASNYFAPPNKPGSFFYGPVSWSPVGRYVLLQISLYEGGSRAILDTQTGHVAGIPDSFEYVGPSALITWMRDGRLFILSPGGAISGVGVTGEIWQINPESQGLLSRKAVFPISLASESYPAAPEHLEGGRLAFAMLNASSTNYLERGLYDLPLDAFVPRRVIGLPPAGSDEFHDFWTEVFWAPDGSGAIVRDRLANWIVYASISTSALYDLQRIVSQDVCCFTWTK